MVKVEMEYSTQNKEALSRYDDMFCMSHQEPVYGKFEDITTFFTAN